MINIEGKNLDLLLEVVEKSDWKIKEIEKRTSLIKKIGFRPILRKLTPRYYAIYATK